MPLTAGRLFYLLWHQPTSQLRKSWQEGGPVQQWLDRRGRAAMRAQAASLPPPRISPDAPPVELHLLTGRNYWDQAAFCLWSFAQASGRPIRAIVYDDGSLEDDATGALRAVVAELQVVRQADVVARLDRHLPRDRFPALRGRWDVYPHLRKLTDPHVGSSGWKLVVDSDLLFFREPRFVLDWLDRPDRPLHAVDCEETYGYPRAQLESLCGAPLPIRCNVGLTGLQSESLDWLELERWCEALTERGRSSYYLEQGLVAMLASRQPCAVAPASDYVTFPRPPEDAACAAVMHHYVALSKRAYFRRNWRKVLDRAAAR